MAANNNQYGQNKDKQSGEGDKLESSTTPDSTSPGNSQKNNRRSNSGRNRSKNAKFKKKPTFTGANSDKIAAVVADEPGLDPLSVQLEKLEKEILSYVATEMTAMVTSAIRTLVPYNFEKSPHYPKPVDPKSYSQGSGDNIRVDMAKKAIQDKILESKISSYVKLTERHETYLQQVFGLIIGNIDEHVQALISTEDEWEEIQSVQDPIRLIKILRKACRQEKGIDYSIAVFHGSLLDLVTCKQGQQNAIEYMQDIKLKYEVLISQFGDNFIPVSVKDSVKMMYDDEAWTAHKYKDCSPEEQEILDRYTKDRLLAYIGVCGFEQKLHGNVSLRQHIKDNAAINKNAPIVYPSDLSDLLKLTTSIMPHANNTQRASRQVSNRNHDGPQRDGAQFAQSLYKDKPFDKQTGKSASVNLMTHYKQEKTGNEYKLFAQTGDIWFKSESEPTFSTLEHMLHTISERQRRSLTDTWKMDVLTKLHRIDIYTVEELYDNLNDVNHMLAFQGISTLHHSTLDAMRNFHRLPPPHDPAVINMLTTVAQELQYRHTTDWAHAVAHKLQQVGLPTLTSIHDNLCSINSLLKQSNFPVLRPATLVIIHLWLTPSASGCDVTI